MTAQLKSSPDSRGFGAVVLVLAFCLIGFAAADSRADPPAPRPRLENHNFLISDLNLSPFVRTYVRTTVGYAQATDLTYGTVVINDDTLRTLDGSLAYAALSFEYQHAIKDWVAFRARANLRSRLGTDATALLFDGVEVTGSMELGWLLRLREAGSTALSASAGLTRTSVTVVDIDQFVDDILEGVEDPVLVDTVPVLRSKAGLQFAWAVSRPLGFTSDAEVSYGDKIGRDQAAGFEYAYGVGVDYDISAVSSVPLGASLGFRQTSIPDLNVQSTDVVRFMTLQIGYNTKPDFLLCLDLNRTLGRGNRAEDNITASGAGLTLRYYF